MARPLYALRQAFYVNTAGISHTIQDMSAYLHLQGDEAADEQDEEDETAALFRLAAEQLKEKREEEAMSVEERILKCVPSCNLLRSQSKLHCVSSQRRAGGLGSGTCLASIPVSFRLTVHRWQKGCRCAMTGRRRLHKYVAWCVQIHDKVVQGLGR